MTEMKYRTRGNSDPHGKPRVFFACHPDEFELYFDEVSELLLNYQNCAVWYFKPEDAEALMPAENSGELADIESRLSEMQLVVMPVTTRLLMEKNPAMDIIFRTAADHHIPGLPLMMESGLDDVLAPRFGDLQYLDPHNQDPTAIPFEERLEKYLQGVLVSDDLAARVRDAFDAYVFLSYRKKDRKYAQQLMRMIHSSERCRNLAIWYDEYLVPGEDFNEAIRTALKKSSFFTLVVTPSLLEDGNYVMLYEYPAARDAGKEIMPFEMKDTDRKLLNRFYEEIPECIGLHDRSRWEEKFVEYLKKLAVTENDHDPMHNFLIGLAYLDGIDVEVDSNRAVELITGSAEAGLEEAMKRLVSMYNGGKGVARDHETAVFWQRKLVGSLTDKYNDSGDPAVRKSLFTSLWDLGDFLYDLGRPAEAKEAYSQMLETALKGDSGDPKIKREISVSYNELGSAEEMQGNLDRAEAYYRRSLHIDEELAAELQTERAQRDLSVSYSNMGDIADARGNLDEAEKYYRKRLEIAEKLAAGTKSARGRRDVIICIRKLGDLEYTRGHLDSAEAYFRTAIEKAEELNLELKTESSLLGVYYGFNNLSSTLVQQGRLKEAAQAASRALEIAEKAAEDNNSISSMRSLASSYLDTGNIDKLRGHLAEAGEKYRKVLDIVGDLASRSQTVRAHNDLYAAYVSVAGIEDQMHHYDSAMEYYQKALTAAEALNEKLGTVESESRLMTVYTDMGIVEMERNDLDRAEEYFGKGFEIAGSLEQKPLSSRAGDALTDLLGEKGDLERVKGNLEEAERYTLRALEKARILSEETQSPVAVRNMMSLNIALGRIALQRKDPDTAADHFRTALKINQEAMSGSQRITERQDLSMIYGFLLDAERMRGNHEAAYEYCRIKADQSRQIDAELRTVESCTAFLSGVSELGELEMQRGDTDAAQECFMSGIKRVLEDDSLEETALLCENLASCYSGLARIGAARGNLDLEAIGYKEEIRVRKAVYKKNGSLKAVRQIAICFSLLGDVEIHRGNFDDAEVDLRNALRLLEIVMSGDKDYSTQVYYVTSWGLMGQLEQARGNKEKAVEYYRKSYDLAGERIAEAGPDDDISRLKQVRSALAKYAEE